MPVFKSKKIKDLESENEMLKSNLGEFYEREEKIYLLNETLNKLKKDASELKNLKADYSITIEYLKSQEQFHKNTIDNLTKEINELREIKNDEQNHLLNLTSHLNNLENSFNNSESKSQSADAVRKIFQEIHNAEERKNSLLNEEEELNEKIKILNKKIESLYIKEQSIQEEINKKKDESNTIDASKINTLSSEIKILEEKIRNIEIKGKAEEDKIKNRIDELLKKETSILERINLREKELNNLEKKIVESESSNNKEQEDRTISLIIEEQTLIDSIEQKKKTISELTASLTSLNEEYSSKIKDYQKNIASFKSKETELELQVAQKNEELNELNELKSESDDLKIVIAKLKAEQNKINESIRQLNLSEELKKENLSELNDILSTKELKIAAIDSEITDKKNKLNETTLRHKQVSESIELKNKELLALVRSIDQKANALRELTNDVTAQEEHIRILKRDVETHEKLKNEILSKINSEKESAFRLRDEYKKLKQIIPLLEKKKSEMKHGNEALESRFANMFQKYSKELNEIGNKKNVLEQMIQKKEKDINEQDQVLFEKLAALEESERVLRLRQTEIESFEDLLGTITDQKEMIMTEVQKLEESAIEKKNFNNELQIESENLKNKIVEFEKGILNIFNGIEARYHTGYEKRIKLDTEVKEYEERLKSLNVKIKDSMNEMFDLQQSLTQIKIEHEEHRGQISKLVEMKKKLSDEIARNQKLFDKYRQVKQKLKNENLLNFNLSENKEEPLAQVDENFRKYALPELTKVFKL